jgi:hypothetical protein
LVDAVSVTFLPNIKKQYGENSQTSDSATLSSIPGYKGASRGRLGTPSSGKKKARRKIRCTSNSFCFDSHSNFFSKFCSQTPHRLCLTTCVILFRLSATLIKLISPPQRPMEGQQKNLFGLPDFSDTPREEKKVVDSKLALGRPQPFKTCRPPTFFPPLISLPPSPFIISHIWSSSLSTNLGLVFYTVLDKLFFGSSPSSNVFEDINRQSRILHRLC